MSPNPHNARREADLALRDANIRLWRSRGSSVAEIAQAYGLTPERVRQICKQHERLSA